MRRRTQADDQGNCDEKTHRKRQNGANPAGCFAFFLWKNEKIAQEEAERDGFSQKSHENTWDRFQCRDLTFSREDAINTVTQENDEC